MRYTVSLLLALAPAGYIWWTGRRLIRRLDDPVFPELRLAIAQRSVTAVVVCGVLAAMLAAEIAPAVVLATVFAALAAGFPARRVILEESWGLWGYLNHSLRLWTAMVGAWFLLAVTPGVVHSAGGAAVPVAAVLIGLAFVWGRAQAVAFPWILQARPLDRPDLAARFDEVLARARCRRPRILEATAPGGRWINGMAVPSLFRPAVVLTTGLLDELSPQEATAIFAHEIGHLEYFNRKRMLVAEAAGTLACGALVALIAWLEPGSDRFAVITWLWPLVMLLLLARVMSRSQAREHESDVRAVELVGDAEVVASALTKLHEAMRLPRRWQARTEARQTHPSLARRLQAIHAHAGGAAAATAGVAASGDAAATARIADPAAAGTPAAPDSTVLVRDARRPGEAMLLGDDRLYWLRGLPDLVAEPASAPALAAELRAVRYEDLTDLRLDVAPGACHLTAEDGDGKRTRVRLAPEDVGPVKAALERTEGRVGAASVEKTATRAARKRHAARSRIWALAAAVAALIPHLTLPPAVLAAIAVWRPAGATLLAAGVAGLGATAVHLLGGRAGLLLPAAAALLLVEAWRWRRRRLPDPDGIGRVVLLTLGAMAVLSAVRGLGALAGAQPALRLHLWARYESGLFPVLLAGSATLWVLGPRRLRRAAAAPAALAGLLLLTATGWFAHRFGGDPLSEPARLTPVRPLSLRPVRELELEMYVTDLRVSPAGRRVAATGPRGGVGARPRFLVEADAGEFVDVPALDLEFLTDDVVVLLSETADERLRLETRDLASGAQTRWQIVLPAVTGPTLRLDPGTLAWEVGGWSVQGRAVVLSGRIGEPDHRDRQVAMEEPEDAYLAGLQAGSDGRAVAVVTRAASGRLGALATLLASFGLDTYPTTNELWVVDGSAPRRVASTASLLSCAERRRITARVVCLTSGPSSASHVLRVDAASGEARRLAVLPSHYHAVAPGPGDRLLAVSWAEPPLLLAPSTGQVSRLEIARTAAAHDAAARPAAPMSGLGARLFGLPDQTFRYQAAALGETVLAIASPSDTGSRITIFGLDQ